jgi:hypothetical protein
VVEFKTEPRNARLMRKNVEIVLIHSLLNVCDESIKVIVRVIARRESKISEKFRLYNKV